MPQESIDHHYLPQFYLSRWCNEDGKLCRYSRPRDTRVVAKFVTPRGTAFEPRLYENAGMPEGRRQSMEVDFLSRLDSRASNALELLEAGIVEKKDWTPEARSDWSRFLLAQQLRAPEDIDQWKVNVRADRRRSAGPFHFRRPPGDTSCGPPTPGEYEEADHAENDLYAMTILRALINNPTIGQMLNEMHWRVLDVPQGDGTLVTSDRPIWMTDGISNPGALVLMPIGPRRLFIAVGHLEAHRGLLTQPRAELVAKVNCFITQQAVAYVYADDKDKVSFVQEHMSQRPHQSLMIRMARKRGY